MKGTYFVPKEAPFRKEDIYTFYYNRDVEDFMIKDYIKTEQWNEKEQITIDSLYNAKANIQNLLSAIEQPYKPVNLSDFDINENNIDSLIDSAFLLWDEEYRSHECYKDIQKCKNIEEFKRFLTKQYWIFRWNSGGGKQLSICIKTSLNTYNIFGNTVNNSNQPWRKFNIDNGTINFDITNSLLEILPKDFYNIVYLTVLGVMQDYIEWCCTGGWGAGHDCKENAAVKTKKQCE
jgi:hypothetical protein